MMGIRLSKLQCRRQRAGVERVASRWRSFVWLGFLVVAATAMVLGVRALKARKSPFPVTLTFTNGSAIRLMALTWGSNQTFSPEPRWLSAIRTHSGPILDRVLGPAFQSINLTDQDDAKLWYVDPNAPAGAFTPPASVEIAVMNPSGLNAVSWGRSSFGGSRTVYAATLNRIDWRANTISFDVASGSEHKQFHIGNPRLGEVFPAWTPGPLPQTVTNDGFVLEFKGFDGKADMKPLLDVRREGRLANDWFGTPSFRFRDPTGNSSYDRVLGSEPVCRVDVTMYPGGSSPFFSEKAVVVAVDGIPPAGSANEPPISRSATNEGLAQIFVVSAGRFKIVNGKVAVAEKLPSNATGGGYSSSSGGGGNWTMEFERTQPSMCILLRAPISGTRLLPAKGSQDEQILVRCKSVDGRYWSLSGGGSGTSSDASSQSGEYFFQFPDDFLPGPFQVEIARMTPLRGSFTIANPWANR
jgi:hypothetical protein